MNKRMRKLAQQIRQADLEGLASLTWSNKDLIVEALDPPYPSREAMMAAVELEIHAALGSVQTVVIGQMIQKAINAHQALTS